MSAKSAKRHATLLSAVTDRRYRAHGDSFFFLPNHFDQPRCRTFNVVTSVFSGSASCGQQTATVNVFEIAVGKFVSALRIRTISVVDAKMPFCIFAESVQTDKLILLLY